MIAFILWIGLPVYASSYLESLVCNNVFVPSHPLPGGEPLMSHESVLQLQALLVERRTLRRYFETIEALKRELFSNHSLPYQRSDWMKRVAAHYYRLTQTLLPRLEIILHHLHAQENEEGFHPELLAVIRRLTESDILGFHFKQKNAFEVGFGSLSDEDDYHRWRWGISEGRGHTTN